MNNPTVEMISATPTMEGSQGLLAIVFRSNSSDQRPTIGPMFITPPEASIQAAFMRYKRGTEVAPHYHPLQERHISCTGEVVIVTKGRLQVNLYTNSSLFERYIHLEAGDMIVLLAGGHGFIALDDVEVMEVKQGPFNEAKDKVRF